MTDPTEPGRNNALKRPHRAEAVGGWRLDTFRLIGGAVVIWGLLSLIGLLFTKVLVRSGRQPFDAGVDATLAGHREHLLNSITAVVSALGSTPVVIAVVLVAALVMRLKVRRWHESLALLIAMVGELAIFLAVTTAVHRNRPSIPRLDAAPPTSSFPSGHTMAAVVSYTFIAFLLWRSFDRRWWTTLAATVLLSLPVLVGFARLYRGMHYPTDVLAGALGGALWLMMVFTTLLHRRDIYHPPPAIETPPDDPLVTPGRSSAVPTGRTSGFVALGSGIALLILTVWIRRVGSAVPMLDRQIHDWVVKHRSSTGVSLAHVVTWGGVTRVALPLLIVVGAVALTGGRDPKRRLSAGLLLAGMASLGVYVGHLLNMWVDRGRPAISDWAGSAGGPSFPSGHTTAATLFAASTAWVIASRLRIGWPRVLVWAGAALYAAAVGWSRVWLGVHWPTDVVAGWLFGATWFAAGTALILETRKRFAKRHESTVAAEAGGRSSQRIIQPGAT